MCHKNCRPPTSAGSKPKKCIYFFIVFLTGCTPNRMIKKIEKEKFQIDLIPDFTSVPGHIDDIILLPGLAVLTVRLIPKDVPERYRAEAEGAFG